MTGDETVDISGLDDITPRSDIDVVITMANGKKETVKAKVRIDTENELEYYRHGGILHYVLRNLAAEAA